MLPTLGRGPWAATMGRGPWAAHHGHGQVEDKMSGFSLHEGVRRLSKSDLVFSLIRCWAALLNTSKSIFDDLHTFK